MEWFNEVPVAPRRFKKIYFKKYIDRVLPNNRILWHLKPSFYVRHEKKAVNLTNGFLQL